jgi:valyl-tRNA synthetase
MSKSLGTGIDPLDVIAEYGADATRYGLLKMSSTQDTRFSYAAIDEGRRLANKLWNVSRLVLANIEGASPELRPAHREEQWILGRLELARKDVEAALGDFDFAAVARVLYRITFDDFCDWYAEAIKPRLYDGDEDAAGTALAALERLLAILHPVLPHVTEEIWSHLPARERRLIVSAWPQTDTRFSEAATALDRVQDAAAIFRRSAVLVDLDGDDRRIFEAVVRPDRVRANGNAAAEIERLRKEIARAEGMLGNRSFVANAPPDVVEGEREKLARYRRELDALGG